MINCHNSVLHLFILRIPYVFNVIVLQEHITYVHVSMYLHYILMSPETSPTAPPRVLWLQLRKLWAPVYRSDWLRQVRVARDLHETALAVRSAGQYFKFVSPLLEYAYRFIFFN